MNISDDSKKKILIVDDNELNIRILQAALKNMNLICDAAFEGRTAVEMASSHRYAMIIMDCQMPGMNGYEATIAIRNLEKPFSEVPIIAQSASLTLEKRNQFVEVGMNAAIEKPIDITELRKIVDHFIQFQTDSSMEQRKSINSQKASLQMETAVRRLVEEMHFTKEQSYSLIKDFIVVMENLIAELEEADRDKNYSSLAEISHKIKGICSNLRFKELQGAAGEIENRSIAMEENMSGDIQKLKNLHSELKRAEL